MSDSLKQLAFWTAFLSGLLGEGATPAIHRLPPQACGLSSGWKAWGPDLTGGPWTCTLQVEGLSVLTLTVLGFRVFWWLTGETAALWSIKVTWHRSPIVTLHSWLEAALGSVASAAQRLLVSYGPCSWRAEKTFSGQSQAFSLFKNKCPSRLSVCVTGITCPCVNQLRPLWLT